MNKTLWLRIFYVVSGLILLTLGAKQLMAVLKARK